MPGGDRTGPMGAGPMTGRGAGYCGGQNAPGYAQPGNRLGLAFRRGFGGGRRGWCHRYYATGFPGWRRSGYYTAPSQEQNLAWLDQEAERLKEQLDFISQQIEEIKKNKENEE